MPRLIFISPYFNGGTKHAAHLTYLTRYMATRDGVRLDTQERSDDPATEGQREFIRRLVKDFPNAKRSFEYDDFMRRPSKGNAHNLIQAVLESNLDQISKKENYADYIANRPRVRLESSHGLFTSERRSLTVSQVAQEVASHPGNMWTPVISLSREDAHRLGYEDIDAWRAMLNSCSAEIARAYKIKPDNLRWYAALHDEAHHPHIHMMLYSADPSEGFLTKKGIAQVKQTLARHIFRGELEQLYGEQSYQRDRLRDQAKERYQQLVADMSQGTFTNERVERLTLELHRRLQNTSGKKVYGYLPPRAKALVDAIVDELAKETRVAEAYDLWYELREDVLRTYRDNLPERLPLSRQKEFKHIRNMVIREALALGDQVSNGGQIEPSAALSSATTLLRHLSRVLQNNTPQLRGQRQAVDHRLKQRQQERRLALGHRADDHEDPVMNP